jgi:ribonucleoside-diphosphate reductase subunit M2
MVKTFNTLEGDVTISEGSNITFNQDRLLLNLGYSKIWNVQNPFDFMESISIEGKTNFFEFRPTEYQKSSVLNNTRENSFLITNDF